MNAAQIHATQTAAPECWNCRHSGSGLMFCSSCGKIQPLPAGTDHFAIFGLPKKLKLEEGALEEQFHRLSWKLHPDNFVRASDYEGNLSLDLSSRLNDAYRTLRDPLSRVEYLLELLRVRKEGAKQEAPPELLEEVFELNESLDELTETTAEGGDTAGLRRRLEEAQRNFQQKLAEIDAKLDELAKQWDAALGSAEDELARSRALAQMNEALNRRSYIRNLVAGVQKKLAEA